MIPEGLPPSGSGKPPDPPKDPQPKASQPKAFKVGDRVRSLASWYKGLGTLVKPSPIFGGWHVRMDKVGLLYFDAHQLELVEPGATPEERSDSDGMIEVTLPDGSKRKVWL